MSDGDLRGKLTKAICDGTPQWSPTVFVAEEATAIIDALMPVVRAAINEARAEAEAAAAVADLVTAESEVARLKAERDELRQKWLTFTGALGFGDNKTERAAELAEMVHPIECAFAAERDHYECAVICELCGDPLASKTCNECHGSGCLPNSTLAYLECGTCAGAGKVHEGCVEKSYDDLASDVAELRELIRNGLDHWGGVLSPYWLGKLSDACHYTDGGEQQ